MAGSINYLLKVIDARPADIQKALEQAGIKVRSIAEVHREDSADSEK